MSASRRSAAYTETPWATGNNAVRYVIVSGAGEISGYGPIPAAAALATMRRATAAGIGP
ncbi:hypothetical protein MAHJHV57_49760 [Mycobacterium avium subsp. hominissuis]